MNLKDLKDLKKGVYHKASWKSVTNNGYEKISVGVVRLVRYGSINGVEIKGKSNPNEKELISNMVYQNVNTGNTLVQLAKSKSPKHHTKVSYLLNGEEITKEEYELANPPKKSYGDSPIFRVKLENLIFVR